MKLRVHLGLYEDETAELCHWHIPEAHYLETWSDARAFDGTVTIMQPLIAPLYGGKSAHELLAALMGQPDRSSYSIMRDYWRGQLPPEDFERFWHTALHEGLIADTAVPLHEAEKDHRVIRDGELVTVCQASCPTEAIILGKINDLNSRVSKLKATQLTYGLLTDLTMQPRTTYLARLRHPHPDLAQPEERS